MKFLTLPNRRCSCPRTDSTNELTLTGSCPYINCTMIDEEPSEHVRRYLIKVVHKLKRQSGLRFLECEGKQTLIQEIRNKGMVRTLTVFNSHVVCTVRCADCDDCDLSDLTRSCAGSQPGWSLQHVIECNKCSIFCHAHKLWLQEL
jgi:hypothetical protein